MSIRIRALIGLGAVMLLVGLSMIFGAALSAMATTIDPTTNCDETTCEVYWEMPGSIGGEATWPQKLAYADQVHCGAWYQIDRYPKDKIDALIADGQLDYQEDWGIAISWHFQYGGDCATPTGTITDVPCNDMAGGPGYHTPVACITSTPTETETPWPTSTPTITPSTTPPSSPAPTSTPTQAPTTTQTVEPSTTDSPGTAPSTETSQPTASVESSTPSQSTSNPTKQSGDSSVTNTDTVLANTGSNFGSWFGGGILVVLAGVIILIIVFTKRK